MLELSKVANVEIAKLVHSEELAFRIRNRRNKQLGWWLAAELDLTEDASDYAKTIVAFGIAEPDDELLTQHIQQDLSRRGVRIPEAAIRFELERQTTLAVRECTILQPSTSERVVGCNEGSPHTSVSASRAAMRRMPATAV
jgi:hypothetical protein